MRNRVVWMILLMGVVASCTTSVPDKARSAERDVTIYPDYKSVTVPCNVAPLNFLVRETGSDVIACFSDSLGTSFCVRADDNRRVKINPDKWADILRKNLDGRVFCDVYVKSADSWTRFNRFPIYVKSDSIDPYLTYRLIEPSYMGTGQIGIYQFNLETAEERVVVRNSKSHDNPATYAQSCVNCHSAQKNHPENKMFYYRGAGGGLLLSYQGKLTKINTKVTGMATGTTYPSWHPSLPFIAFSSNDTRQNFPNLMKGKVDIFDLRSDLVLYDIERNEVLPIAITPHTKETHPTWSPDGNFLYYASTDSSSLGDEYRCLYFKYDLKRVRFDASTRSFGEPELVYCASKDDRSVAFPRVSPDGRFLLFVLSDYGSSPHTHDVSDLYLIDLTTGECRPATAANSDRSESYHDFSSKGRWFVFYSRRDDGNYGRAYISYMDADGKVEKPFQLPHTNPETDLFRLKNYNMIEFASSPVLFSENDFYSAIEGDIINANGVGHLGDGDGADTYTGASSLSVN